MGLFRRGSTSSDGSSDLEFDDDLEVDAGIAEEVGPLGPTGRPLHPVGAYFEAAFRRFGVNFGGYLLIAAISGLPLLGVKVVVSGTAISGLVAGLLYAAAFALGNFMVLTLATMLVVGSLRGRLGSVLITGVVTVAIGTLLIWLLHLVAIVFYPLLAFPSIIVASGDGRGFDSIWQGMRMTVRWFKRTYACVLGLAIVIAAVAVGFGILLTPLGSFLQQQVTFAITTIIVWPVAALVFRNLYGDVTGRLVINDSPKENERRKEIIKRRRAKAKRNRERIKKVTGEE
ncbi:MAG: hypothetical protein EXQ67_09070 [Thermoleophilia bacterium]|nr:hypothetical protein [Thermoleophilia bacterium]